MSTSPEKDGALPTYEEAIFPDPASSGGSKGQLIIDQLTTVRAKHIRSIIDEHVYPKLQQQATYGIAKTTIALIPSDSIIGSSSTEDRSGNFADIVGFPSDEVVEQVQLEGRLNRVEFWRQPGVIGDLERTLQDRLATAPFAGAAQRITQSSPPSESPRPAAPQRKGFFGRRSISTEPPLKETVESRTEPSSQLQAQARLEEVCIRTMSEFGLYETASRPAVIIRVVAGI